jgi:hypothetical protein
MTFEIKYIGVDDEPVFYDKDGNIIELNMNLSPGTTHENTTTNGDIYTTMTYGRAYLTDVNVSEFIVRVKYMNKNDYEPSIEMTVPHSVVNEINVFNSLFNEENMLIHGVKTSVIPVIDAPDDVSYSETKTVDIASSLYRTIVWIGSTYDDIMAIYFEMEANELYRNPIVKSMSPNVSYMVKVYIAICTNQTHKKPGVPGHNRYNKIPYIFTMPIDGEVSLTDIIRDFPKGSTPKLDKLYISHYIQKPDEIYG